MPYHAYRFPKGVVEIVAPDRDGLPMNLVRPACIIEKGVGREGDVGVTAM